MAGALQTPRSVLGLGEGSLFGSPCPCPACPACPALPPLPPRCLSRAPCHHPSPGDWGCVPAASPGRHAARVLPRTARRARHPCPAEERALPTAAKYKSWGSESWLETSSPELSFLPRCLHAGIQADPRIDLKMSCRFALRSLALRTVPDVSVPSCRSSRLCQHCCAEHGAPGAAPCLGGAGAVGAACRGFCGFREAFPASSRPRSAPDQDTR